MRATDLSGVLFLIASLTGVPAHGLWAEVHPEKVTMLVDIVLPVPAAVVETTQPVAAGTEVQVITVTGESVKVAHGIGEGMVKQSETDFRQRVERLKRERADAPTSDREQSNTTAEPASVSADETSATLPRPTDQPAQTTDNPIVLAEAVAHYYLKNEVRAETELKGVELFVKGTIKRIAREILGYPYVVLGGTGFTDIQCIFAKSDAETVAGLTVGENVVIRGTVSGKMMNILLRDCSIYEK